MRGQRGAPAAWPGPARDQGARLIGPRRSGEASPDDPAAKRTTARRRAAGRHPGSPGLPPSGLREQTGFFPNPYGWLERDSATPDQQPAGPDRAAAKAQGGSQELWTGHLKLLQQRQELRQCPHNAKRPLDNALGEALRRAFRRMRQEKGRLAEQLIARAGEKTGPLVRAYFERGENEDLVVANFQDDTCNHLSWFFINKASVLSQKNQQLEGEQGYAEFMEFVIRELAEYTYQEVSNGRVSAGANVTQQNAGTKLTFDERAAPDAKRLRLLGSELAGLLRLHVGGHFFVAERIGNLLHCHDNQYLEESRKDPRSVRSASIDLSRPIAENPEHSRWMFEKLSSVTAGRTPR